MELTYRQGDFNKDVLPLVAEMKKAHVTFENPPDTIWFVAVSPYDEIAGVAAVAFTKNTARFKSVYVQPFFRRRGAIYKFFQMVDEACLKKGIKRVTGFFNSNSVHAAVKYGYVVQSVNANGVSFAERYL